MKKMILFSFAFVLFSCNEKYEKLIPSNNGENYEIVLKERNPSIPLVLSKKNRRKNNLEQSRSILQFKEYLGRSYIDKSFPVGNAENIFFPVIDIKKLEMEIPNYITELGINKTEASSFAYSTFDRYVEKSKITKKINTGFSINLGLFSLGAKHKMTEIFTKSITEEGSSIFGELNVMYKANRYTMQFSSNINRKIILDYLTPEFEDELYNTHPDELIKNYGGFVLMNFITGGRATALYSGFYKSSDILETKEKDMNTDINASYSFEIKNNSEGKVSTDFGIGKDFSEGKEHSNKIECLSTSIKTIGGSPTFSSFTIPKKIDDVNIDLSQWANSLNDESKHAIIDIVDGGLVPLVAFVMEHNLSSRFNKYYTGKEGNNQLEEPYIEIRDRRLDIANLKVIITSLVTRFGDYIILDVQSVSDVNLIPDIVEKIKEEKTVIYGLKVKYNLIHDNTSPIPPTPSYQVFMKENELKKFVDIDNKVIYLIYHNPNDETGWNGNYALSIHYDYLLDTYTIRKLVDSLPTIKMTREQLFDYKVIAL